MSLNWRQFELGVLRPTLEYAAFPGGEVAVKLVGETLWHESDQLRALGQYPLAGAETDAPFGPGLGIASIELPTWDWMVKTPLGVQLIDDNMDVYEDLAWDLRLNVIACRLRYFLNLEPLPPDTLEDRATYWWKVYNRGQVDRRTKYIADAKMIRWVNRV